MAPLELPPSDKPLEVLKDECVTASKEAEEFPNINDRRHRRRRVTAALLAVGGDLQYPHLVNSPSCP